MQEAPVAHCTAVNLLSIGNAEPAFENLGQSVNYKEKVTVSFAPMQWLLLKAVCDHQARSVIALEPPLDQEPALGWAV